MTAKRSRVLVRTVLARAGRKCQQCGAEDEALEVDHILPLALGGEDKLDNLQALCPACHKRKTADDIRRMRKADRIRRKHERPHDPPQSGLYRGLDGRVRER